MRHRPVSTRLYRLHSDRKESPYTDAQAETYTDDEKELLSIYKALPAESVMNLKGEMKGYLKALEESKKYLDRRKRLSV